MAEGARQRQVVTAEMMDFMVAFLSEGDRIMHQLLHFHFSSCSKVDVKSKAKTERTTDVLWILIMRKWT